MGAAAGLLDADVDCSSVRMMLAGTEQSWAESVRLFLPVESIGLKAISMGFLSSGEEPISWCVPMLRSVIQQLLRGMKCTHYPMQL